MHSLAWDLKTPKASSCVCFARVGEPSSLVGSHFDCCYPYPPVLYVNAHQLKMPYLLPVLYTQSLF